MRGIAGKRVLVTGATSGIGQAIAVRFAAEGASVAVNHRAGPEDAAETLRLARAAAPHAQLVPVRGDVSVEEEVVALVAHAVEALGGLDVLVANAGVQESVPTEELAAESWDRVLGVNLRGAFLCSREAIRHFLAAGGGAIVNVSSVHERIPRPRYASYAAAKGGLGNLTRTLALEYAGRGIRVNALAPGAVGTSINSAWAGDEEKQQEVASHIPLGRVGTVEEMAGLACFLVSDDAAYVTGQTLYADGGLTLYADFREPWSAE